MKRSRLLASLVVLCLSLFDSSSRAETLAVTHADFSTAAQGTNGFFYGYYNGPDSTTHEFLSGAGQMQSGMDGPRPAWFAIGSGDNLPNVVPFMQHPGSPGEGKKNAVRRYVVGAPGEPAYTGEVRVVGRFYDVNSGSSNVFVAVDLDGDAGPEPRTLLKASTHLVGPAPVTFDFPATVAADTTIDFGVLSNDDYSSDGTGVVAWIVTDDVAVPTHALANNYSSPQFSTGSGSQETRGLIFALVTDGVISGTDIDSFDTTPAAQYAHAGLLYSENSGSGKVTKFNSVRIDVTTSGDFAELPHLFLLRHNSDPGSLNPAQDERYVQLPVMAVRTAANSAGQPYYTFDLSGLPESQRTGYGFTIMGRGNTGAIAVSEISADATRISDAGHPPVWPAWIEHNGHRYALSFTRGTWEQTEAEAVSYGGHLVSINSEVENEWVFDAFGRGANTYIGLRQNPLQSNVEPGGGWTWMDGTVLNEANGAAVPGVYANWNDGRFGGNEPNHAFGAGEDYVTFAPSVFGGRSVWGDIKNAGYPETADYRGIIELNTVGSPAAERNHQLTVSGQANIFGAGQANPTPTVNPGVGGVPAPSVMVLAGEKVRITASSGSAFTGAETSGVDGTHHSQKRCDITGVAGISGYKNFNNSAHLVGVFVSDTPLTTTPERLDFSTSAIGEAFTTLSPGIGQVFFIGDGLTPGGRVQEFVAPAGATRLFIGMPDAYSGEEPYVYTGPPNAYGDNSGYWSVRLAVTPTPTPQISAFKFPEVGGQFKAFGGDGTYTWSIGSGTLPAHLQLNPDGSITSTGQPRVNGRYNVVVVVTDGTTNSGDRSFTVAVEDAVSAPAGLAAWWPGQNTVAEIIGGDHLAVAPSSSFGYTKGKVGRAFHFDGTSQSLQSAEATDVMKHLPLTIEAWIKPEARTSGNVVPYLPTNVIANDRQNFGGHGFGAHLYPDGSMLRVGMEGVGAGEGLDFHIVPDVTFTDGVWVHVAVVYTEGNVKTYLDGELKDDFDFEQGELDGGDLIRVGRHNDDAGYGDMRFFKGAIDEISLYHAELDESQVQSLYLAGAGGKQRHDAGLEFSNTDPQPEGSLWTYGSYPGTIAPSTFVLSSNFQTHVSGVVYWEASGGGVAALNPTGTLIKEWGAGGAWIHTLPNQIRQHPGSERPNVIRWTAPAAGRYAVSGSFTGLDEAGVNTICYVYHNALPMTQLNGQAATATLGYEFGGNGHSLTGVIDALEDETVDFIVSGDASYDSTGTFASVVYLGPSLSKPTNLQITATTPLTTQRLWTFSAMHEGDFPGLELTVQYATATDPDSWTDIPILADSNLMNAPSADGAPWTLAAGTLPLPAGNYFFRVRAAADYGLQSFSTSFGMEAFGGSDTGAIAIAAPGQPPPPLPLTSMPTPTTLSVLINNVKTSRGKQGDSVKFTAQVAASPTFSTSGRVEVEYSSTPSDGNSWSPLCELVFAGRASSGIRTYTATQTNLPPTDNIAGGFFFRLKASAPDRISVFGPLNKQKSVAPAGPFFITGTPSWEYVTATLSVPSDPTGDTAFKGEEITYSIKFKNNGGVDATDVEASIPVPAGTKLISKDAADLKSAGARVTWLLPTLAAGSPEVVRSITVQVTANALSKITPGLFTLKCKQLASRSAVPLVAPGRTGFVTYVVSPFSMTLSGVPSSVAPGQLLDLNLTVKNPGTDSFTAGVANFLLPQEVLVEELHSTDSNGNFIDTPLINPSPTSSPSLTSTTNGLQQEVKWNLGTIAPGSTREMQLSVRVRYDAKDVALLASGLTSVYKIVFDRYNFSAKNSNGKTLRTFSSIGPAHTALLNGAPTSLPPVLSLTKKAQADGKLVGAAINTALPGETLYTAGLGEVTTVEQNKRLLYTLQYSNTGAQRAEDVILHDEIPAGVSFQGWIRFNGTLISTDAGITLKDAAKKLISMQDTAKYPKVRFIEIKLGDLAAGVAGEWSYETLATGKVGTFLVSQNRSSITKLGTAKSRQKSGHYLQSPSFAQLLPRSAAIQYSLITGPATFDVQPPVISGSFRPGNSVLVDIPYRINGGDGIDLEFKQMKIVLRIPRYYELGSASLSGGGTYNVAHLSLDAATDSYNIPRGTLPGESAPTLSAMDSKGYSYLTFTLRDGTAGPLPGGRQGAVRAVLRLPNPVPAQLLTASGHLKEAPRFIVDPSGDWRRIATSGSPVARGKASSKNLPSIPADWLNMSGNVSLVPVAPLPPKQAEPFIGRIAPVSVTPGQDVTFTIFFGNPTPFRGDGETILTNGELAMAIPPGTTFKRATVFPEVITPGGNGESDNREQFAYQYELVTKDGQQFIVWPEIPFLVPHSAGAAQITVNVPTTFKQSQIQDTRCYLKFQNGLTVTPGTILVGVKQSNPLTWLMDAVGSIFNVIGAVLEGRALEVLQPQINKFNEHSRTTTICGTQMLQLDNGVVVVPLGGFGGVGRCLTFGPKRFIDASTFNVLADDGATVVVAGMDNTPGMSIKGLAINPQGLARNIADKWSPADAIRGLTLDGSSLVAAGAGNMVAAGGGNMVAAGAGNFIDNSSNLATLNILTPKNANMVAAGAGNMVAAGGGNLIAVGSMVAAGAGNMVAAGAGNFFPRQGTMVAAGGGNMVAAGAGNLVITGAATIRAADLPAVMGLATRPLDMDIGGFVKNPKIAPGAFNGYLKNVDAGKVSAADATLIGLDGGSLVAAGAGN